MLAIAAGGRACFATAAEDPAPASARRNRSRAVMSGARTRRPVGNRPPRARSDRREPRSTRKVLEEIRSREGKVTISVLVGVDATEEWKPRR